MPGIRSIACGGAHTVAAQFDGTVLSWGANQNGVLGLGREAPSSAPVPRRLPGVRAERVAAGWKHSAALDAAGRLYAWGWGGSQGTDMGGNPEQDAGQLGQGNDADYWQPMPVRRLETRPAGEVLAAAAEDARAGGAPTWKAVQVSCGLNHTAAVVEVPAAALRI